MTITSATLLIAADEFAKAERARAWLAGNNMPAVVRLTRFQFEHGQGLPGYEDVREELAKLLAEALPAWIRTAVASIEANAIAAVRELSTPTEPTSRPKIDATNAPPVCQIPEESSTMCAGCICWKRTRADCG